MILQYRSNGEEVVLLQRALNEIMKKSIKADGDFGKITEEILRSFQVRHKLPVTGIYGQKEQAILEPFISKKYLRLSDIEEKAKRVNLPQYILKAIRVVEARGEGFLPDGRVIILFERHKFYKEIAIKYGYPQADNYYKKHPSICNPNRGGYKGNQAEWPRIELAATIDKEAAYKSASFGLFQIMGFNYKAAGYSSVSSFVTAMQESEKNQFDAVISFIKAEKNLLSAVLNEDYDKIALYYNGATYKENNYHTKLRNAAQTFK